MTKENYITMRESGQINIDLLFEYYLENCNNPLVNNINGFNELFQQFFMMFRPDLEFIYKIYDVKFNLNILKDKEGKIIKIY